MKKIALAAECLLNELESSELEVALVPQKRRTNEGGMIRVAINKNVTWYRKFCAEYLSSRKRNNLAADTRIKRRATIRCLQKIASGIELNTIYAERIRPYLLKRV